MTLTRRRFGTAIGKMFALTGLGSLVSTATGCPAWLGSVYTDIIKYGPVALSALASVVSILVGGGVNIPAVVSGIITLIKTGIADLQMYVSQYQDAPQGNKTTLVGQIATALADVEANIQSFWSNLTIPDAKLSSLIEGLLGIVVSTLQGFSAALPAPAASTRAMAARPSLAKTIQTVPKRRSPKQFKSDFNAMLTAQGYTQHVI